MNITSFEIKCSCGFILKKAFKNRKDQMHSKCINCNKVHYLPFPGGYEVCKPCKGRGYLPNTSKWSHESDCKNCHGVGLITWTDKILRGS